MVTNVYGYLKSGSVFSGWRSEFFLGAKFLIVANLSYILEEYFVTIFLGFWKKNKLSKNIFGDSFVKCVYSWLM
jgi:hypothetical protein